MKTLYLLNTETNEPAFSASFVKVAKSKKLKIKYLAASKMSFLYDRQRDCIETFYEGKKIKFDKTDYVFARRWGTYLSAATLLFNILHTFKVPYLDSEINLFQDITSSKLAQPFQAPPFNVHFPTSWVFTKNNILKEKNKIFKKFSFPMVLKTQGAGRGRHVWRCDSKADFERKVKSAMKEFGRELYVVQEFIPNDSDIRVIVFQGKVVTAIERSSNNGFYNNISQGGSGKSIKLTREEEGVAKRAAKMARLDLAGVDIVRTKKGPLLFEVNKGPDIKCFNEPAGFDIATKLAEMTCKKFF